MTPEELTSIVESLRKAGKDNDFFEAKRCKDSLSKDVWETVSAFANTRGGTLLLGLSEEDSFLRVEGFNIEKVLDQFVEGIGSGGATGKKVDNPPHYAVERIEFEGGEILVIELGETEDRLKPCFISARGIANGSFKRIGDKDVRLSPTEVYELQHLLLVSEADREAVGGTGIQDLDEDAVKRLIEHEQARGSKAMRGATGTEGSLKRMAAMNADGEATLAGLMCLGVYPQEYFPKLVVDVAAHAGLEKAEPGAPRFMDRVICEGSIGELVDDAVLAVAKNLKTFSFVEGSGRRDELEIPREVLREAIANAVVHREYSKYFVGQSVSVDVFADRVEITNPGGLWGGKTLDTIADGQSRCRNTTLVRLASRVNHPGQGSPVEGQGSGIPLMYREMRSRALGDPKFEAGFDYFKVTLQRGGAELVQNREWITRITARETTTREEAVLLSVRSHGESTVGELHNRLGYDSDEVRRLCRALESDGLLVKLSADKFGLREEKANVVVETEKGTARSAILAALKDAKEPIGIREIGDKTGRNLATLRAQMKVLVEEGLVHPTAPANHPSRKYEIAVCK